MFADLGFPDAAERQAKLRLAYALNQVLDARKISQADAAKVLGVTQPKVSALRHYKLAGFSVERLMNLLTALDQDVEIVIRRKPRSRKTGRISVEMAASRCRGVSSRLCSCLCSKIILQTLPAGETVPKRNYSCGTCFIIAWVLVCLARTAPAGDDWRQFRGPNGSGISHTRDLPVELGPERNRVWKTSLPPGHSSPALTQDRIFVTAFEGQTLLTICLELKTGRILWRREVPRNRSDRLLKPNNPASPSPVTDGKNVYVFFQDFGLLSYAPDGQERWRLPLGPFNVQYGFGASPILVGRTTWPSCRAIKTRILS